MLERYRHSVEEFFGSTLGLRWPSRGFVTDAGLALVAGLVAAGFAVWLFFRLDFEVLCRNLDVWLDSDPGRVVAALSSRFDQAHHRTNLHPLWSIGVTTPFLALTKLGIMDMKAMVTTYVALSAASFGASIYIVLRLMRVQRIDSFLALGLCLSTSSAWLWFGIPELFLLGGVSFMVPLIWLATPRGQHDAWSGPLQSAVSLAITITNWVAGLFAALLALGLRRGALTALIAFAMTGFLAMLQYRFFPQSGAFFNVWTESWVDYGTQGTFLQHVQAFWLTTIAAPMPDMVTVGPGFVFEFGDRLSRLQFVAPSTSPIALATICAWGILAARGLWVAARGAVQPKVALFVLTMIAFNFILHAVYGIETFLYSLHYLPFFTFIAGWGLLADYGRPAMRALVVVGIFLGSINNMSVFESMMNWHNAIPPETVADWRSVKSCK
ncbi:hypothetical protein [Mesorhizobium sp. CAU 1741]|uniref:hypothetical protein n=1 Tax=Mesorhizobium sp. CAU 1741 TaxID=3140366 RepID=UPI00325A9724